MTELEHFADRRLVLVAPHCQTTSFHSLNTSRNGHYHDTPISALGQKLTFETGAIDVRYVQGSDIAILVNWSRPDTKAALTSLGSASLNVSG